LVGQHEGRDKQHEGRDKQHASTPTSPASIHSIFPRKIARWVGKEMRDEGDRDRDEGDTDEGDTDEGDGRWEMRDMKHGRI